VLGIVANAARANLDPLVVARLHFAVGEALGLPALVSRILALPRRDRWQSMARATLRDDLHTVHAQLTSQLLTGAVPSASATDVVAAWTAAEQPALQRAGEVFAEICSDDDADLARMSVALRVLRSLVESS
jgi:glutamate dehydrogenase